MREKISIVLKATKFLIICYGSPMKQIQTEKDDSSGLCSPILAQVLEREPDIRL